MKSPAANSSLGSEYDNFLFALVGEDPNGLPLTVVSLLGRKDLDPWQEAAALADLPADTAAQKLASLLCDLPERTRQQTDTDAIAIRLIPLLPRRHDSKRHSIETPVGSTRATHPPIIMTASWLAIYLIFALAAQFAISQLAASRSDSAPTVIPAQAPTATPD